MTTNFTGFFINFFSEIMVNILHLSQKTRDDFVLSHTQSSRVERKYFEIQSYVYLLTLFTKSSKKKSLDGKKCHFQIKRILHLRLVQAKKIISIVESIRLLFSHFLTTSNKSSCKSFNCTSRTFLMIFQKKGQESFRRFKDTSKFIEGPRKKFLTVKKLGSTFNYQMNKINILGDWDD